jgi:hypothetical protein
MRVIELAGASTRFTAIFSQSGHPTEKSVVAVPLD